MDERLRELERAAATGLPGARAAWLAGRIRAGTLEQDRLRLAAYVGDPDARAATGEATPPLAVVQWVEGLAAWGREPWRNEQALRSPTWRDQILPRVVYALAAAACADDEQTLLQAAPGLEACQAWLSRPSLTAARKARAAFNSGWRTHSSSMPALGMVGLALLHVSPASTRQIDATKKPGEAAGAVGRLSRQLLGEGRTRQAVRDAIVPWVYDA